MILHKGPMDKDNGVGIVFESGGSMGQERGMGGKMGTTVTEQLKKRNVIIPPQIYICYPNVNTLFFCS